MFASNSRYYGLVTYQVTTSDGKSRIAVVPAVPNPLQLAGFHRRITGDRLDLIADYPIANVTERSSCGRRQIGRSVRPDQIPD